MVVVQEVSACGTPGSCPGRSGRGVALIPQPPEKAALDLCL